MQLSDQARNWVGYAMIVTLVLGLVFSTIAFGAVTIDLAAVVYGLGFVLTSLWAVKLVLARSVSWKASPLHYPVAAFAVYAVVRYATCPFEYGARLELLQILLCTLFYFAAAANFYRHRDRAILLHVLVALAVLESAYAFWQFFTHAEKVLHLVRPPSYQHRGSGTFICPNHFAGFVSMVLGMALACIAVRRAHSGSVERSTLSKVYLAYASLVLIVGVLISLSRGAWVSTAIGVLLVLLWGDWRQRAMWARIGVAVVTVVSLMVIATRVDIVRDYIQLTFAGSDSKQTSAFRDPTFGGRMQLWNATLSVIGDRPAFGGGPSSWQWYHLKYRHPALQRQPEYTHNDFLNLTADYGLVGLVLGLAVIGCFYWQAILLVHAPTPSEQRAFAIGSLAATTILLLHSWMDFNLHILSNALLLATLMGFTAAIEDPKKRFARAEIGPFVRWSLAIGLVAFSLVSGWHVARTAMAHRFVAAGNQAKKTLAYHDAVLAYKRAISADPRNPEPFFEMANIYLDASVWMRDPARAAERKQYLDGAIGNYLKGLALQPMDSLAMLRLAKAYETDQDNEQALKTYLRALEIDPNSAEVNLRIGKFYERTGEVEKAAAALKKSQSISEGPNYSASLTLLDMGQSP